MAQRAAAPRHLAPGPPGQPIFGNLRALQKNPLQFLMDARRDYRDIVRLQIGPRLAHLVSRSEWIRYVLATHQQDYPKSLQYYVDLVPGHVVEPEPLVTLRPRNGVLVTLRRRTGVRV